MGRPHKAGSQGGGARPSVLFVCTGNYYRSRFAECYFAHIAWRVGLPWDATSRGTLPSAANPGWISPHTLEECRRLGLEDPPVRPPMQLESRDLVAATLTVAMKESEHRPSLSAEFPQWHSDVRYWHIDDIDCAAPVEALRQLRGEVERLVEELLREHQAIRSRES